MISRVIIAGGGIGGLTLAAALRRRGVQVTVFEREAELRPAGAGLALGPNAMMALARIGLAQAASAAGFAIERSAILDAHGRSLSSEIDVAQLCKEFGHGIVALHRTRLHDVLVDAVGRDQIRTNTAVIRYDTQSDCVEATCRDGERVTGDLLVAADGLHSTLRAQMVGDGARATRDTRVGVA